MNDSQLFHRAVEIVADVYQITPKQLLGRDRSAWCCEARQVLYHLTYFAIGFTLVETGQRVGERGHDAVARGVQILSTRVKLEPELAARFAWVLERFAQVQKNGAEEASAA